MHRRTTYLTNQFLIAQAPMSHTVTDDLVDTALPLQDGQAKAMKILHRRHLNEEQVLVMEQEY